MERSALRGLTPVHFHSPNRLGLEGSVGYTYLSGSPKVHDSRLLWSYHGFVPRGSQPSQLGVWSAGHFARGVAYCGASWILGLLSAGPVRWLGPVDRWSRADP